MVWWQAGRSAYRTRQLLAGGQRRRISGGRFVQRGRETHIENVPLIDSALAVACDHIWKKRVESDEPKVELLGMKKNTRCDMCTENEAIRLASINSEGLLKDNRQVATKEGKIGCIPIHNSCCQTDKVT